MQLRDFLNFFDFDYEVNDDKTISLTDLQGGNYGDIENEIFSDASDIADRLDIYYHDYIYRSLSDYTLCYNEPLYEGKEDYPTILEWLKENYPDDKYYTPIVECIVNPDLLIVPELQSPQDKLACDLLKTINDNWKKMQRAIDLVHVAEAQERLIKHSAYTDMAYRLFNESVFWHSEIKKWIY